MRLVRRFSLAVVFLTGGPGCARLGFHAGGGDSRVVGDDRDPAGDPTAAGGEEAAGDPPAGDEAVGGDAFVPGDFGDAGDSFGNGDTSGCAGTDLFGACWYLAAERVGCTATCAGKGGYNVATRDVVGSGAADSQPCKDVLTAAGVGWSSTTAVTNGSLIGCCYRHAVGSPTNIIATWFGSGPTDPDTVDPMGSNATDLIFRVCACGD